jgi:hypothetical protein
MVDEYRHADLAYMLANGGVGKNPVGLMHATNAGKTMRGCLPRNLLMGVRISYIKIA